MVKTKRFIGPILISFFIFINLFIWSFVFAEESKDALTVAFLDVGQGDAIFIEAPNGNQMLIDGGPNSSVLRELGKVMPFQDRSIDIVVATHPDRDHISGLIDVFKRYDISMYLDPGVKHDTGEYNTLINLVSDEGLTPIYARRGMKIFLDEEVFVEILFPDRDVSNVETNLGSIIMRIVYRENEVLLTGDAPQSIEKYIVSLGGKEIIESDLLKAGHHGSKTSSSESFVGFVNPKIVVISSGKNNQYGHPHKEVIDILKKFDVKIVNTADFGTIIFKSDGVSFTQN